jgi:hypothetical protein
MLGLAWWCSRSGREESIWWVQLGR